jgi:HEPN domain-containing protein
MDESVKSLVRAWLVKAEHDLGSARKLAEGPDPYLDTAPYHCQQPAEKAVKGLLVFFGESFEKVHNIPVLINQGIPHASELAELLYSAESLTPYATLYRYPDVLIEPDPQEYEEAIAHAERIYTAVLSTLPEDLSPHSE